MLAAPDGANRVYITSRKKRSIKDEDDDENDYNWA